MGGLFTEEVLTVMGQVNERPIIMPMSNPVTNSECSHRLTQRCTGAPLPPPPPYDLRLSQQSMPSSSP